MHDLWKRLAAWTNSSGHADPTDATRLADQLIAEGNALEDAQDFDAALARYRKAVSTAPAYARAYMNVGNALRRLGRPGEAIDAQRSALHYAPESAPAHFNLGLLLSESGDLGSAEAALREALSLDPTMTDAALVLGDVLETMGRMAEAEAELRRAISLRPGFAGAMLNLGQFYLRRGRFDEAENLLLDAMTADPSLPSVDAVLGSLYFKTGREADGVAAMARALGRDPELSGNQSGYLFSLNLHAGMDASAVFSEHKRLSIGIARTAGTPYRTWANPPDPKRRIKLGYVSGDFAMHPVGLFIRPVLLGHDRTRFEVHCYSNYELEDPVSRGLRSSVEHWHSIAGMRDDLAAEQLRTDQIDILVDLSGHTDRNRLGLFALHPAPVQVTWLGYLNTSGLSAMDYRICDHHTDPKGIAEHLHTEQIYRLPHSQWCYAPVYDVPLIGEPHAKEPHATVFGSFNQYSKISDVCLDFWSRVLTAIPESRFVVLDVPAGRSRDRFRHRLRVRGVDPDRVSIRGREAIDDYFAAIGNVDVAFDTFPYNGATTTLDTLWMGVPVVALPGDRGIARSSYSILQSAGLTELIASSPEAYVALNIRLVRDGAWRSALRRTLRSRLAKSSLMNAAAFVADLEVAYAEMWGAWCNRSPR